MATMLIKPFIRRDKDSIGLSDLNLNAFPGTSVFTEIPIRFGKYITGFDPNAFYLDNMDEKKKAKEKKAIEDKIKEFDLKYPHFDVGNIRVETLPDGSYKANQFYRDLEIEFPAEMTILNTEIPVDLIKIEIIKTNAKYNTDFDVAPDLTTAQESNRQYKYYIVDADRDVEQSVTKKKELNKAITLLDTVSSEDKERFLLIIKFLLPANKGISTESEMRLYKRADDYINGIIDGEKVRDGENFYKNFIKACEIDRTELFNKVLIKYAIMSNVITFNGKTKDFEFANTNQELGKTPEDIYRYLTTPKNMSILEEIKTEVQREVKII